MSTLSTIFQTYRQALWRRQHQWISVALMCLVMVVMIAVVYLSVTARTDLAGRQIQVLEESINTHMREIADYETTLAELTSIEVMQERARDAGYRPAEPGDVTFVVVAGYVPPSEYSLTASRNVETDPLIQPEYTESLFDWIGRRMIGSSLAAGGR